MSTALSPFSPSYGVSSEFQVFALVLVKSLSESDSASTSFKNRRVIENPVDETTDKPHITIKAEDVNLIDNDQSPVADEYEVRFYVCALF